MAGTSAPYQPGYPGGGTTAPPKVDPTDPGGSTGTNPYYGFPIYGNTTPATGMPAGAGYGYFQGAYNSAGQTLNNFNMDANRLRERLDSAGRANEQSLQDSFLGRGMGATGALDRGIQQTKGQTQYAYGQGLASLSDMFEKNRLTGVGLQNEAASGILGVDRLNSDNAKTVNDQDITRRKNLDDLFANIFKTTTDSSTAKDIAHENIKQAIIAALGPGFLDYIKNLK